MELGTWAGDPSSQSAGLLALHRLQCQCLEYRNLIHKDSLFLACAGLKQLFEFHSIV